MRTGSPANEKLEILHANSNDYLQVTSIRPVDILHSGTTRQAREDFQQLLTHQVLWESQVQILCSPAHQPPQVLCKIEAVLLVNKLQDL
jgi:hypothetical protein